MATGFNRTARSLAIDTPALALVLWALAAVLLGAWFAWFFLSRVTVYEVSQRARLEVRQSAHPVASAVASTVLVSRLALGRTVAAGETLVELDAGAETGRLREEQARLETFAPRLQSLQREMQDSRQALTQDQQAAQAAIAAARARAQEAAGAADFARETERRAREDQLAGGTAQVDVLRAGAEARRLAAARDALLADVRRLEGEALLRLIEVRRALETSVVRKATINATPAQRAEISRLCDVLLDDVQARRPWRPADWAFHGAIYEASGNPMFGQILNQLDHALERSGQSPFGADEFGLESFPPHRMLADAIVAADPEAAIRAINIILDIVAEEIQVIIAIGR